VIFAPAKLTCVSAGKVVLQSFPAPLQPCTLPALSSPDRVAKKSLPVVCANSKFRVPLKRRTTFLVSEEKPWTSKEYTLGVEGLLYVPHWADDPDALYREAKKLSFTPETVTMYGKTNIIERQTWTMAFPTRITNGQASIEWEGVAIEIRKRLEAQLGILFTSARAKNQYAESHCLHRGNRDKNTILNGESVEPKYIASLSLGSARKDDLRPKEVGMKQPTVESMSKLRGALVFECCRQSGSVLERSKPKLKHAIPQDKTLRGRISLTYREF